MANSIHPMEIKQVISLHRDGISNRKIGSLLGISRNTVNQYVLWIKATGHSLEELLELAEVELRGLFPAHTTINNERFDGLMYYFERFKASRQHPGFTFLHHYQEYCHHSSDPYSYTQFMEHFHRRYAKQKGSMKLEHLPGHEIFIDFAGKKLKVVDRQSGEVQEVEVFVAILPFSQYTYVEACRSQKREDLIHCMNNMMRFFGGAPKAIVSDNLKSAVSRASKYEPDINRSLKEFARHYDCVINPTRVYRPQDKALVEKAVHLSYQRIYYPIKDMTFFSLEDLNQQIWLLLDKYNDMLFQRKEASRKELYQSIERSTLKPLPMQTYQLKNYARAKVQKIGYVFLSADKSYYSVPYRYIGQSTHIHYSRDTVEVYCNDERIALHQRNKAKGHYNTIKTHLSSSHQQYLDWNPDYFKRQAAALGHNVELCISMLFEQNEYPETAYKSALGIMSLAKAYGKERLDTACDRAMYAKAVSYKRIKNMLQNKQDMLQLELIDPTTSHIPPHENIRGASTYQ